MIISQCMGGSKKPPERHYSYSHQLVDNYYVISSCPETFKITVLTPNKLSWHGIPTFSLLPAGQNCTCMSNWYTHPPTVCILISIIITSYLNGICMVITTQLSPCITVIVVKLMPYEQKVQRISTQLHYVNVVCRCHSRPLINQPTSNYTQLHNNKVYTCI